MKKLEILLPAVIIAFTLFVLAAGIFYYEYEMNVMRFPYLVGGILVALSAWRLVQAVQGKRLPGEPEEPEEPTTESVREFAGTAAWLLGILPCVWLLGYPAGVTIYIFSYLKTHGESWLTSAVLAAAGFAITYFVFVEALRVRLPVWPIGMN